VRADDEGASRAGMPFASIARRISGDVEYAPPGNRPRRSIEDFEAAGGFPHQLDQRLFGGPLDTRFTSQEYQPDFIGVIAGRFGGGQDEPREGPASCRPAQANQPSNFLPSKAFRPGDELIGRVEVFRRKAVNDD